MFLFAPWWLAFTTCQVLQWAYSKTQGTGEFIILCCKSQDRNGKKILHSINYLRCLYLNTYLCKSNITPIWFLQIKINDCPLGGYVLKTIITVQDSKGRPIAVSDFAHLVMEILSQAKRMLWYTFYSTWRYIKIDV